MSDNQKILEKAKMCCICLREELGYPRWMRDVIVNATTDGKYFLVIFVSELDETVKRFTEPYIRKGFRGFKVEIKLIERR